MSQYYEIKISAAVSDVLFVYISCLTSAVFCVSFCEASAEGVSFQRIIIFPVFGSSF